MVSAAAYLRASTEGQTRSASQQKHDLTVWAQANDVEIVRFYVDEGRSGTSFDKRPAFKQLIHDVENHPAFKLLLVWDESRWSRTNPRESSYWKQHFKRHGVPVKIINSRSDGSDNFASWLMEGVESEESGEYSRKLSRATFRGQSDNSRRGFSSGGRAPFGYVRAAVNPTTGEFIRVLQQGTWRRLHEEKVSLVVGDPVHVEIVRRIFRLAIDGHGDRAIADILNREGVVRPETGSKKNSAQRWSCGTVRTIVRNPVYRGARAWSKTSQSDIHDAENSAWENRPEQWVVKEDAHQPIVTKEEWLQANVCKKKHKGRNRYTLRSPYLLAGLLECVRCHHHLHGITKIVHKKGCKRGFYIDAGFHARGRSACIPLSIKQDELEQKVFEVIGQYVEEVGSLEKVRHAVRERLANSGLRESKEQLRLKIGQTKRMQERFFKLIETGTEAEAVRNKLEGFEKEMKDLEDKLRLTQSWDGVNPEEVTQKVSAVVVDYKNTFKQAPPYAQKVLIRKFIEKIHINPETRTMTILIKRLPGIAGLPTGLISGEVKKMTLRLNGMVEKCRRTVTVAESRAQGQAKHSHTGG
jgi:DNA invertase Pin-like site-specific DNA recombinase